MLISLVLAGLSAVAVPQAISARTPLWRDLEVGMTPDQAAAALRKVDGIKAVEVTLHGKKEPTLKVTYLGDGIDIGAYRVRVSATFSAGLLNEVTLTNDSCRSVGVEADKTVVEALKAKYGNSGREKVVDDNGVLQEYRFAFWNDLTRVRVAFSESNPGIVDYVRGGSKLAQLANALAESGAAAARAKCPVDVGARLMTTITYSSQAVFNSDHNADIAKRDAKKEATKSGL